MNKTTKLQGKTWKVILQINYPLQNQDSDQQNKTDKISKAKIQQILKIKTTIRKILNDWEWKNIPDHFNEVTIVFTDDHEIKNLNLQFRNKGKATDVLSFSQSENEFEFFNESLGDIVISLDTALRQADEFELTLEEECLRLAIHGLLHLIGYEHEHVAKQTAEEMYSLQEQLWSRYKTTI